MTKLILKYKTPEQLDLILKAEKLLLKAGIQFDTGTDGKNRVWELDFSLKNAEIKPSKKEAKIKVYVRTWYPDEIERPPTIVGVYRTPKDHATNEDVKEFELED